MTNLTRRQQIEALEKDWATNPRWKNVKRTYTAEEVVELRGSMVPANTIAQRGADKLWSLVNGSAKKGYVNCLGALTGGQAVQQAKATSYTDRIQSQNRIYSCNIVFQRSISVNKHALAWSELHTITFRWA